MKKQLFVFLFLTVAVSLFARPNTITMRVENYPGNDLSYSQVQENVAAFSAVRLDVVPNGSATLGINSANTLDPDNVVLKVVQFDSNNPEPVTTISGVLNLGGKVTQLKTTGEDASEHPVVDIGRGEVTADETDKVGGAEFTEKLEIVNFNSNDGDIILSVGELFLPGDKSLHLFPGKLDNDKFISGCKGKAVWTSVASNKYTVLECDTSSNP